MSLRRLPPARDPDGPSSPWRRAAPGALGLALGLLLGYLLLPAAPEEPAALPPRAVAAASR